MNAVAPGLGADIEDRIPWGRATRIEDLVLVGEANSHRVDEDVAVIAFVELGLARDCRHADTVSVAANARHDASDEAAGLRVIGRSETKGVDQRDRARAHGEYVPQDTTNAGRRPLIGLDIGGVVVTLHLEDGSLTIADINDACILTGALNDFRSLGGEFGQVTARGFVGAVLRPHHRIDAQLNQVGLAPEAADKPLPFILFDAMFEARSLILFSLKVGEDRSRISHGAPLAAKAPSRQ